MKYTLQYKKYANILAGLLLLLIIMSFLFAKIRIECKSQIGDCPGDLNSKLHTVNGKYLFLAKSQASKILKNNFLVTEYSLQFKLPNILQVNILIKKTKYSIFNKSLNKYIMIDNDGLVLMTSDQTSFPILIKENFVEKEGQKISENDLFALKLIEGINQMYQINTGTIQNDTLVVDLPTGVRVILPIEGDIKVLLGSLRLIYTKLTAENSNYSQIDLRFKNPVIK